MLRNGRNDVGPLRYSTLTGNVSNRLMLSTARPQSRIPTEYFLSPSWCHSLLKPSSRIRVCVLSVGSLYLSSRVSKFSLRGMNRASDVMTDVMNLRRTDLAMSSVFKESLTL